MPRRLGAGQRSRILTMDVDSRVTEIIHESAEVLYEAPNWSLDGMSLVVNGDGHLFRIALGDDSAPERIDFGQLEDLNNDHVLDPDGAHVFLSAGDGHIHRALLTGGPARRVTNDNTAGRRHFLHGVSPDGRTLAYIGINVERGVWGPGNIFTIPAAGGEETQLTDDEFPDDGVEYSPDGEWLYFNSERAGIRKGHAQLFRMRVDGTGVEQLTFDDRVNWFPHVSPDGARVAYISFPPGTEGHPADHEIIVRLCDADGAHQRDLIKLFGGQGTMNVPSWSPDSRRIAFVEYPVR